MSTGLKSKIKTTTDLFVSPRQLDEDQARREYIFNILLLGTILLTVLAFLVSFIRHITVGSSPSAIPPFLLIMPATIFGYLYYESRRKFRNSLVYSFLGIYLVLGIFATQSFGIKLPQGLMVFVLVITMSSILLPTRLARIGSLVTIATVLIFAALEVTAITSPNTSALSHSLGVSNAAVLLVMFCILSIISGLSNKQVEVSLERARFSEQELLRERKQLEVTIAERTKELETIQIEKSREMYRFAEFGRLSSGLVHDLANPLTAVSLSFGQLESGDDSESMNNARSGIAHMEQYLTAARRQLRSQGDVKPFEVAGEISKVISFLDFRARTHRVKIDKRLKEGLIVNGDVIKFSQVVSNLIANAIDSYSGTQINNRKAIVITSKIRNSDEMITISIKDYGSGIDQSDLTRIFEPFYSTKSSDRGTGIGLTITKRIVEQDFRGTLSVATTKTRGTTFTVAIPLISS